MQAIRQFNQDDPNILGHGHDHLAETLRLALVLARKLELVELGDASHQRGHFMVKQHRDLLLRSPRYPRWYRAARHWPLPWRPSLGQDMCHRKRMGDVGAPDLRF